MSAPERPNVFIRNWARSTPGFRAKYFSDNEGIVVRVEASKVEIITSEKTEKLLAKTDYVSKKREQEYIIRIPNNYKFKKDDITITDEDYLNVD